MTIGGAFTGYVLSGTTGASGASSGKIWLATMCPGIGPLGGPAQPVYTMGGGHGPGTRGADHGHGAHPGGGGAPLAFASVVQSAVAGFVELRAVEDCMAT